MTELQYEEIIPKVYLYRNLFPDSEEFTQILSNAEFKPETTHMFKDWEPWSRFGTYAVNFTKNLRLEHKQDPVYMREKYFLEKTQEIFLQVTSQYLNNFGLSVGEDWVIMGPSFCKYTKSGKQIDSLEKDNLVMGYHTDYYKVEEADNEFALTCTMYLNDNYEGGEVCFKMEGEDYVYKPQAGDVMVFPSGHPDLLSEDGVCLHGVKKITEGLKYFVRIFYQIPNQAKKELVKE